MMQKQEQHVKINDINMYYTVYGKGKPLLLIHGGLSTGQSSFRNLIPLLSEKFQLFVPDSRGHGRSDNPSGILSYRQMAADYLVFIEKLEINQPVIIGFSDGGQIALEMIIKNSDIGSFIVYGIIESITEEYLADLRGFGISSSEEIDLDLVEKALGSHLQFLKQEFSHVYGDKYYLEYLRQLRKMWINPNEFPGNRLSGTKAKLRVMQGDRDEGNSIEQAINIYRMVQGSELCIVPNATHYLPIVDAERFLKNIEDFLN
ncbi:MAG: alpha/beta fold hydrolase [Candidatus Kariarchaeaceae archaeon]|jgi:pimeloyl-ACP methyl ester carboxylesterase